jgi:nucleoside-diphosphate-sugar epimerase
VSRVLVIGGTGFVSGAAARALIARGHEVTAYHRGPHPAPSGAREIISPHAAIPVLRYPRGDWDAVVHAVAVGDEDARAFAQAYEGKRLVALSSGDVYRVYGAVLGLEEVGAAGLLAEDAPLRSVEYPYGRGPIETQWGPTLDYEKLHVERAVLAAGGTVLRLGKVYGRGDAALERAVRSLRSGLAVSIERPDWRWTHVYVENVAHAVVSAVESSAPGPAYNVGESDTPTQLERMRMLARVLGMASAEIGAVVGPPVPDLVLDSARIRRELGFVETPFADALSRSV